MATNKTELFKQQASIVHNNKYDYSLVEYKGTHAKIKIICSDHGIFEQSFTAHRRGQGCPVCAKASRRSTWANKSDIELQNIKEKTKQTNQKIYGVAWNITSTSSREKQKQTMVERYGVEYFSQSPVIQEKIRSTNLDRHGVEHFLSSVEVRQQIKQTCIQKYGVDNPRKSKIIQKKIRQTNTERYGVEFPIQNEEIQKKIRQTNTERYGVEFPIQNEEIQEKIQQTCLDKFGTKFPTQKSTVKEVSKNTCLSLYGVEYHQQAHMVDVLPLIDDYDWLFNQYITLGKTATQIATEMNVNGTTILNYLHIHNIEIRHQELASYKSMIWIEYIMESENIHIQHAQNGGEFKIPGTNYRADGYCKETNTIYEFHGDYWHGNPNRYESEMLNEVAKKPMGQLYQNTIKRENKIKSLGFNLVVVWESDFTVSKTTLC